MTKKEIQKLQMILYEYIISLDFPIKCQKKSYIRNVKSAYEKATTLVDVFIV